MPADTSEITEALSHIPADDRDTWVRAAMAIKSAMGDAGREPWDEWSRSSDSYDEADARDVWKSIAPDGGVTIASLFAIAREHGYQPRHSGHDGPRTPEAVWNAGTAEGVDQHPYLAAKGVKGHGLRRHHGTLLVPVRDDAGRLLSVQRIYRKDGQWQKRFCKDAKLGAGFHQIGEPGDGPIILAEGYATGASVHEATGHCVIVGFDCGRLATVGQAVRAMYPQRVIVIAADDDAHVPGNPGVTKATAAAKAIGAKVVVPAFAAGGGGDFNDLMQADGSDVVRRQIEAALLGDDDSGAAQPPPKPEAEMGSDIDLLDGDGKKKSQVTLLIELAARWETFHDRDDHAYAVIETGDARQVHPIRSQAYRRLLSRDFLGLTGKGCNGNSISDALATIEAKAIHHSERREVYLRTAHVRFSHAATSHLFLDMGDETWGVIEVTAEGWRVLDRSPVEFVRKGGVAPLPKPERGGDIRELERFLNLDAPQLRLAIGWILRALSGTGPYPVMVLQGEHGTGKSTATRVLRSFTDPSTVPLRSPPRDVSDLLVSASNNRVVVLDNLSGLNNELSDCLCRFATGGGLDKRKLFTDQEQILVDIQRPVMVNGIDDIATRPDLLSRSLVLNLPVIDSASVQSETAFDQAFEAAKPRIFGAVLDALSCALRRVGSVHLERKPRMADFALWVTAAEPALGWADGAFMAAYDAMHHTAIIDGIEASPVGSTLLDLLKDSGDKWMGSPTQLFNTLTDKAGPQARSKAWPLSPKGLKNALHRLAPSLRRIGVTVVEHRTGASRLYEVHRVAPQASYPSYASSETPKPSNHAGSSGFEGMTDSMTDNRHMTDSMTDKKAHPSSRKPSNGAASSGPNGRHDGYDGCKPYSPEKGGRIEGDRI